MLLVLWKRWLNRNDSQPDEGTGTEQRVAAIQAGDESLREAFIMQYRPYIARTASRFCKRYVDQQRDDEFSVALVAFNEAIDRYSPQGGSRFFGFAEMVIKCRLIDYARQEQRHAATVPYGGLVRQEGEDDSYLGRLENAVALEKYNHAQVEAMRRTEIETLSEQLARFGIRFSDLAEGSPRHRDSRQQLQAIGRRIATTPELFGKLLAKRQLPIKELVACKAATRKTLERHRKYIIAVALIAGGAYPCLKQYISAEDGGKEEDRG